MQIFSFNVVPLVVSAISFPNSSGETGSPSPVSRLSSGMRFAESFGSFPV